MGREHASANLQSWVRHPLEWFHAGFSVRGSREEQAVLLDSLITIYYRNTGIMPSTEFYEAFLLGATPR